MVLNGCVFSSSTRNGRFKNRASACDHWTQFKPVGIPASLKQINQSCKTEVLGNYIHKARENFVSTICLTAVGFGLRTASSYPEGFFFDVMAD